VGNRRKPRGVGAASTPMPLMTWPPRHPDSTLVLRLNQETIHDSVLPFLPPCGPHLIPFGQLVHRAEPTCLSTPRRPHKAKTFRACSSHAPTQVKTQPTPAILDQESVHTMLSITHHTKERPSTGPRSLRFSRGSWFNGLSLRMSF
jgi:hypothetical protein